MVASTLTVVSCLHRHASLDSMREVETVQPLASLPTFGRTVQFTPRTTWVPRINIPRRADHSGHEPQPLHDLTSQIDITVDLDGFHVLVCRLLPETDRWE